MTITYPLSMPSTPLAQRWLVEVELPRMKRDSAAYWQAFFLALRGRFGTFLLGSTQ